MGCELGRGVAGADVQGYDGGFEIAVEGSVNVSFPKFQTELEKNLLQNDSLDESDSCGSLLRFQGSLVLGYLFPLRIVGARLCHLDDIGAVVTLHFDVARVVCHSAQDANFGVCHYCLVFVRRFFFKACRKNNSFLFVRSTFCTIVFNEC